MLGAILGGLSVAADIFGADSARQGQREANETNLQIAREQMGFQREMSDTAYQRAVKDMKAAGLNPMLALMRGGASTPPGASAHMENEQALASGYISSAFKKATEILSVRKMSAEARKIEAEAALTESEVPFSAGNAQTRSLLLTDQLTRLGQDIEKMQYEIKSARLTSEQLEQMNPLLLSAQKLVNQGMRLQMSRKELEEATSDFLKIPFKYGGKAVEMLNKLGSGIGQEAADAADWFKSLPEKWREFKDEYEKHRRSGESMLKE